MPAGRFAVALMLYASTLVQAAGFNVEKVVTRVENGFYVINADIDFRLSEDSLEALENGVALTLVVDVEIVRTRKLMWDELIAALGARYQLQIHALSGKYMVKDLDEDTTNAYTTLGEAVTALGNVDDLPVIDARRLAADDSYALRLRARLDIEALPAPLRPLAYLSSPWHLDSGWESWPIVQ